MKSLKIQYAVFFMLVIVAFSSIVLSEKMYPLLSNKVDEKLETYIKDNYKDLDIESDKTIYKNTKFQKKVYNKDNKNLYFTIYYRNKKIKDDYKKEYVEGNTFLKYISKLIEKDIKNKTNYNSKVSINKKLNNYNDDIKERLIKEKDLSELSIYNVRIKIKTKYDKNVITDRIKDINNRLKTNNIKPKELIFEITNEEDITKSVKITIIDNNVLDDTSLEQYIDNIINEKEEKLVNNKIKYKYLN